MNFKKLVLFSLLVIVSFEYPLQCGIKSRIINTISNNSNKASFIAGIAITNVYFNKDKIQNIIAHITQKINTSKYRHLPAILILATALYKNYQTVRE